MSIAHPVRRNKPVHPANHVTRQAIEPNEDPSSTEYPKCFFGMEVKKGSWKDLSNGRHRIELDQDFPNGTGDDLE